MASQYCLLCASNEGVFLDITPDNQVLFDDQFNTCLSIKIVDIIELSNKICYKCAYELEQCTNFVRKYRKSQEISELPGSEVLTSFCSLCLESIGSGHIFDITQDNRAIFSPLQKVRNIFKENSTDPCRNIKLICLVCRYNLDVLFDLKKLYKNTIVNLKALINEEIDYSDLSKVYTDVVNRKTTITTFPELTFHDIESSDCQISDDMAGQKKRVKNRKNIKLRRRNSTKSKVRNCDQCHKAVTNDDDMYRFYRTGLTVCKNCWITIDPTGVLSPKGKTKRRFPNSSTETKLCTVFLKDVLSDKTCKVECDKDGNKIYILSDESSSHDEDKSPNSSSKKCTVNEIIKRGRKRGADIAKSDIKSTPSKITKLGPNKKHANSNGAELTNIPEIELPSTSTSIKSKSRRKSDDSSDSDVSLLTTLERYNNKSDNRSRLIHLSALEVDKSSRKRLKNIIGGIIKNPVENRSEFSDESSSTDTSINLKRKNISTSPTCTYKELKRKKNSKTSPCLIVSKETTPPTEIESSVISTEIKVEYMCDKCDKTFDSKLLSAEHKLVHLRQCVLRLERLSISEIEEKQITECDDMQVDKISQKTDTQISSDGEIASNNKNINNSFKEDVITVTENNSDKEISSSPKKCNEDAENECVSDKPKIAEDELCVREESMEIQSDDKLLTEESQESNKMMVTEVEKNENAGNETKNTDISDDESTQKDNIIKDDSNIENDKDTMTCNDAEISTIQKEVSPTESNNDKGDPSNEIISESKNNESLIDECTKSNADHDEDTTIEEQVSLTESNNDKGDPCNEIISESKKNESLIDECTKSNADHDENTNHLENSQQDNKNELKEDQENKQCDLTTELAKENSQELEENNKTISDVTVNIETLNNEKDLNDRTLILDEDKPESLEKSQNDNVELIKEIDEIDASNITQNNIKSDFVNCETHKVKDVDVYNGDVLDIDNDLQGSENHTKKLTEETSIAGDLKDDLRHDIDTLEQLIEEVTIDKKCEVQETLNHPLNSPADAVNEILSEIFDLATAEEPKREESDLKELEDEVESLESISHELRSSADMPSLDPICAMETD